MSVQSLAIDLPFDQLSSWQKFQRFCLEFVLRLPGVIDAAEYGRHGDNQHGIDLIARFVGGTTKTYQCRQAQKFQKSDVEKVVRETTVDASDRYIITSCTVSPITRDACPEGWFIWTPSEIAPQIRLMERWKARSLVHDFFGTDYVKSFLGLDEFPTFVPPKEFFKPFLEDKGILNHGYKLVGREQVLRRIEEFLGSTKPILILSGNAGIGKSKIMFEASQCLTDHTFFFADPSKTISVSAIAELPENAIIVVDDALKHPRLDAIVSLLAGGRSDLKIILTVRPYSVQSIQTSLSHGGYFEVDVEKIDIQRLSHEDALQLAEEVLGTQKGANRLSSLVRRDPLLIVMIGKLIRTKGIDFSGALSDGEFRTYLLSRFKQEITAEFLVSPLQGNGSKVITLLAILSPIQLNDPIIEQLCQFLSIKKYEFLQIIDRYEHAGILVRRKGEMALSPDLLADYLIEEACYAGNQISGYSHEILSAFSDTFLPEILYNLSELDARRSNGNQAIGVFDQAFSTVSAIVGAMEHPSHLLNRMRNIAYYQPKALLTFAKDLAPKLRSYEAISSVAELVRPAGYNADYSEQVFIFLWNLARDGSDGALKELSELISFQSYKPIIFSLLFYPITLRQMRKEAAIRNLKVIETVLKILFSKTAMPTYYEAGKFYLQGIKLPYEPFKDARKSVIVDVIMWLQESKDVRMLAIDLLIKALEDPSPTNVVPVSDEDRLSWEPEQLLILRAIERFVDSESSLVILQKIINGLLYHAHHSRSETVKELADQIISKLKTNQALQIYLAFTDDRSLIEDDYLNNKDRINISTGILIENYESVVDKFRTNYQQPLAGYDTIKLMLQESGKENGTTFLSHLSDRHPTYSWEVLEQAVAESDLALVNLFHRPVQVLRRKNLPEIKLNNLRNSKNEAVQALYASSLAAVDWNSGDPSETFSELASLLDSPPAIASSAIRAMFHTPKSFRNQAMKLISKQFRRTEPEVLRTAFDILNFMNYEDQADASTIEEIIENMLYPTGIEDSDSSLLLNRFLLKDPDRVIEMLLKRIEKSRGNYSYRPLPELELLDFNQLSNDVNSWKRILIRIRDEVNQYKDYSLAELFKRASCNFHDGAPLEVLSELLDTSSRISEIAFLLSQAEPVVLFNNSDFIIKLIESARNCSEDVFQEVVEHLQATVFWGSRGRTIGFPCEVDVIVRDRSSEILSRLPANSPAQEFFERMLKVCEDNIERDRKYDEAELEDTL